jgi:hypothetical protein
MRMLARLVSVIVLLAVAPPALAEPTWFKPVAIRSTGLAPGNTLSCDGNPLLDGQGFSTLAATFAWTRDNVAIPDATTRDYLVRNADLGHEMRCQMSVETPEGPLSGTSEAVVPPVVDDGPPRPAPHGGGVTLDYGAMSPRVASMNVPAVIREVGPVLGVLFCNSSGWLGTNGPTGVRWTFEFLRNGTVVDTFTRDGNSDLAWRGNPVGWVDNSGGGWPQFVPFAAWHRMTAADTGQFQCRVTLTNGVGQATATSYTISFTGGLPTPVEQPTGSAPAKLTAKPASGVLRRGSFKVTYTGKGKLNAKAGKHLVATGTAKSGTATLKLTAAGRKLLKRKHRLTVTVTAGGTSTRVTLRA